MQTTTIAPLSPPWGALKASDFAPEHQAAFRAASRRVRGPRQVGGDDGYQYALWVDGRRVESGLTIGQARPAKNRIILALMNGTPR